MGFADADLEVQEYAKGEAEVVQACQNLAKQIIHSSSIEEA